MLDVQLQTAKQLSEIQDRVRHTVTRHDKYTAQPIRLADGREVPDDEMRTGMNAARSVLVDFEKLCISREEGLATLDQWFGAAKRQRDRELTDFQNKLAHTEAIGGTTHDITEGFVLNDDDAPEDAETMFFYEPAAPVLDDEVFTKHVEDIYAEIDRTAQKQGRTVSLLDNAKEHIENIVRNAIRDIMGERLQQMNVAKSSAVRIATQNLENQLASANAQVADMKEKLGSLTNKHRVTSLQLREKSTALKTLQKSYQSDMAKLKGSLAKEEAKAMKSDTMLEGRLADLKRENEQLQRTLEERTTRMKVKLKELLAEKKTSASQIAQLRSLLTQEEQRGKISKLKMQDEIRKLRSDLAGKEQLHSKARATLQYQMDERRERMMSKARQQAAKELDKMRSDHARQMKRVTAESTAAIEAQVRALKDMMGTRDNDKALQAKLKEYQGNIEALSSKLHSKITSQSQATMEEQGRIQKEFSAQLDAINKAHAHELAKQKAEMNTSHDTALKKLRDEHATEVAALSRELDVMTTTINTLNNTRMADSPEQLVSDSENLVDEVEELMDEINDSDSETDTETETGSDSGTERALSDADEDMPAIDEGSEPEDTESESEITRPPAALDVEVIRTVPEVKVDAAVDDEVEEEEEAVLSSRLAEAHTARSSPASDLDQLSAEDIEEEEAHETDAADDSRAELDTEEPDPAAPAPEAPRPVSQQDLAADTPPTDDPSPVESPRPVTGTRSTVGSPPTSDSKPESTSSLPTALDDQTVEGKTLAHGNQTASTSSLTSAPDSPDSQFIADATAAFKASYERVDSDSYPALVIPRLDVAAEPRERSKSLSSRDKQTPKLVESPHDSNRSARSVRSAAPSPDESARSIHHRRHRRKMISVAIETEYVVDETEILRQQAADSRETGLDDREAEVEALEAELSDRFEVLEQLAENIAMHEDEMDAREAKLNEFETQLQVLAEAIGPAQQSAIAALAQDLHLDSKPSTAPQTATETAPPTATGVESESESFNPPPTPPKSSRRSSHGVDREQSAKSLLSELTRVKSSLTPRGERRASSVSDVSVHDRNRERELEAEIEHLKGVIDVMRMEHLNAELESELGEANTPHSGHLLTVLENNTSLSPRLVPNSDDAEILNVVSGQVTRVKSSRHSHRGFTPDRPSRSRGSESGDERQPTPQRSGSKPVSPHEQSDSEPEEHPEHMDIPEVPVTAPTQPQPKTTRKTPRSARMVVSVTQASTQTNPWMPTLPIRESPAAPVLVSDSAAGTTRSAREGSVQTTTPTDGTAARDMTTVAATVAVDTDLPPSLHAVSQADFDMLLAENGQLHELVQMKIASLEARERALEKAKATIVELELKADSAMLLGPASDTTERLTTLHQSLTEARTELLKVHQDNERLRTRLDSSEVELADTHEALEQARLAAKGDADFEAERRSLRSEVEDLRQQMVDLDAEHMRELQALTQEQSQGSKPLAALQEGLRRKLAERDTAIKQKAAKIRLLEAKLEASRLAAGAPQQAAESGHERLVFLSDNGAMPSKLENAFTQTRTRVIESVSTQTVPPKPPTPVFPNEIDDATEALIDAALMRHNDIVASMRASLGSVTRSLTSHLARYANSDSPMAGPTAAAQLQAVQTSLKSAENTAMRLSKLSALVIPTEDKITKAPIVSHIESLCRRELVKVCDTQIDALREIQPNVDMIRKGLQQKAGTVAAQAENAPCDDADRLKAVVAVSARELEAAKVEITKLQTDLHRARRMGADAQAAATRLQNELSQRDFELQRLLDVADAGRSAEQANIAATVKQRLAAQRKGMDKVSQALQRMEQRHRAALHNWESKRQMLLQEREANYARSLEAMGGIVDEVGYQLSLVRPTQTAPLPQRVLRRATFVPPQPVPASTVGLPAADLSERRRSIAYARSPAAATVLPPPEIEDTSPPQRVVGSRVPGQTWYRTPQKPPSGAVLEPVALPGKQPTIPDSAPAEGYGIGNNPRLAVLRQNRGYRPRWKHDEQTQRLLDAFMTRRKKLLPRIGASATIAEHLTTEARRPVSPLTPRVD
ncbi:hypothetical protein J8273_7155 [Carpediemonas membranifera]|uniref:Uncharacterized protein n=1 Tax=Carpediemonas membranifera TaxID=201153 RepID=A0A8J6AS30_9EUKA|nr:hypothetical protein J8273_7155 [Carpediemonas membranifera]|eukprot:KAG9390890.1 hypothetical protein J8273_7155 [Carpediemonas membranifera]